MGNRGGTRQGRAFAAAALAAAGLSLSGCKTIPLGEAPFAGTPKPVPSELYAVDWWRGLVTPGVFEYQPTESAGPALDPDSHAVVVLTRDGRVRALDAITGHERWAFRTQGKFQAGATVVDGVAYIPGGDGLLYALQMATGKLLWSYPAKEELATAPTVGEGLVVVASETDTVFAVDAKTGAWKWQYRRDTPSGFTIRGASRPTFFKGALYAGFSDGTLVSLRAEDGTPRWEKPLGGGTGYLDVDTSPVFDGAGHLYVASYKEGVFQLDPDTGDTRWNSQISGLTQLIAHDGRLYATGDEQVVALAPDSGATLWVSKLKSRAGRLPAYVQGLLLVPTASNLMFLDASNGRQRVAWDPGAGVTAPALVAGGGRVFVLSNNGYVYAMRIEGGSPAFALQGTGTVSSLATK